MRRFIRLLVLLSMVAALLAGSAHLDSRRAVAQGPPVVILVVDDFEVDRDFEDILQALRDAGLATDVPADPNDWAWGDNDELCMLDLDHAGEQGVAESDGMGDGPGSHGDRVFNLLSELQSAVPDEFAPTLVKVPVEGYHTSAIATEIVAAMENNPADHYVINMSFGLVPCRFYSDLAIYLQAIRDAKNSNDWTAFGVALHKLTQLYLGSIVRYLDLVPIGECLDAGDPDCDAIQTILLERQLDTIAVAAAGNFGFTYPIWPAGWPGVVSVSAGDEESGYLTPVGSLSYRIPSNSGEIVMPGIWPYENSNGVSVKAMGTSYAAPRLAFVLAVAKAVDEQSLCIGNDGVIGFAYAGWQGYWRDLGLVEANDLVCPDFLPVIQGAINLGP